MTIEIWGKRRNGKSLFGAMLGLYLSQKWKVPLYSNDLKMINSGVALRETEKTLLDSKSSVHYLDEFWREMDSHEWKSSKGNIMTQWWQLQGHHDIVLIYTTQLRSQMNNRIRESNDYSIFVQKKKDSLGNITFNYKIFDCFDWKLIKNKVLREQDIRFVYDFYDYTGHVERILT